MKTVRFSEVVKRCGAPETHLLLTKPAQDKALQKAIKAKRVMTVFQHATGTKTDSGKIGFEEGGLRQYFVFPRSLKAFVGRKVIGIKYDLLSGEELPASERAKPPKPPKRKKATGRAKSSQKARPGKAKEDPSSKVIAFPDLRRKSTTAKSEDEDDDGESSTSKKLSEIKRLAQRAMDALEDGKQIAAFNLLKRIAEY